MQLMFSWCLRSKRWSVMQLTEFGALPRNGFAGLVCLQVCTHRWTNAARDTEVEQHVRACFTIDSGFVLAAVIARRMLFPAAHGLSQNQ